MIPNFGLLKSAASLLAADRRRERGAWPAEYPRVLMFDAVRLKASSKLNDAAGECIAAPERCPYRFWAWLARKVEFIFAMPLLEGEKDGFDGPQHCGQTIDHSSTQQSCGLMRHHVNGPIWRRLLTPSRRPASCCRPYHLDCAFAAFCRISAHFAASSPILPHFCRTFAASRPLLLCYFRLRRDV